MLLAILRPNILQKTVSMNLEVFTTEELERLLKILPEEIRRREAQDNDAEEAERRKRSVFASFQELAKKQGVSLIDL